MKDKKIIISIGGIKLQVKENKKTIENKHKKFFLAIVNKLISIQERTDKLFGEYGVNLIMYEDLYFQIIEDFVYEHYGDSVAEVIFWHVNGTKIEKEEQFIQDTDTGKRHKAKTPLQIYNVCKKLKLFKK